MNRIVIILLLIISCNSYSQISNGYYVGYERICLINSAGEKEFYDEPRKWYHMNHLLVQNDSIFIYKAPFRITHKDTLFSASDGGFYYYSGKVFSINKIDSVSIWMTNCDYCARKIRIDTATGYNIPASDTLKFGIYKNNLSLIIDNITYKQQRKDTFPIPKLYFNQFFKFDENSIYRKNPKGQYDLISTSIENFFNHDTLIYPDSVIICLSRIDDNNNPVEVLNANSLTIHPGKYIAKYMCYEDIAKTADKLKKPLRFLEIGEIIDYKNAARISLKSNIYIPVEVSGVHDRIYNVMYEFLKQEGKYILQDDSQTGWEVINR